MVCYRELNQESKEEGLKCHGLTKMDVLVAEYA